MSASVVSGTSIKAHSNQQDASHMGGSRSSSPSFDINDQDSIIDFEDELQQELENEMSASFDNLFGDEADDISDTYADSRSMTGISAPGDRLDIAYSDNEDEDFDVDDELEDDGDERELDSDDEDDDEDNDNEEISIPVPAKAKTTATAKAKASATAAVESDTDDEDIDADIFGDGSIAESDDDDLEFDFEDPPDNPAAPEPVVSANGSHKRIIDDDDDDDDDSSASEDEFEAVDFGNQAGLESSLDHAAATAAVDGDTGTADMQSGSLQNASKSESRKRLRTQVHIGDIDMLERYKDEHPSLTLHLFDSHFRFDGQEGVFLYNGPMRFFFEALNEGRIPIDLVDVLAQVNCRYYEGCLIVEVRDHRRPTLEPKTKKQRITDLLTSSAFGSKHNTSANGTSSPTQEISHAERSHDTNSVKVYKKVMRPTSETVNLDIQLVCENNRTKLTQDDILEMEGMILLAIEDPLDLEPDFQVSRVSNAIRYIEYGHLLPRKLRKYNSAELEAEKAEREEKLKLLTIMDDRKSREFQPSFNRVSQVNEWRHKKYVNDAEPYPAAVPASAAGKKSSTKKSRSQLSLMPDGRKVVRTLRFVQTINGQSTHTVFHVLELPEGKGLQGVMRWGVLPDTSINGGTKMFSFPNEEIMRMHIDNFKLLLSIENNRLIYDSIYPNGIPTAGPPPGSVVSPPSTSRPPPISTASTGAANDSADSSPVIESEMPSPVVASTTAAASTAPGSPAKAEAPKPKTSVAKNGPRGSRKNSPQPKSKKGASNASKSASASVEPEATTAKAKSGADTTKASKASGQKSRSGSKKAGSAAGKGPSVIESPAVGEAEEPEADSAALAETALDDCAVAESAAAASASTATTTSAGKSKAAAASKTKSASKASTAKSVDEAASEAKATPAEKKKGAKGSRKTPVPKEKKPRAKSKAAAAKAAAELNSSAADSSAQPDAEKTQSRAASQQPTAAVNNTNGTKDPSGSVTSSEETPLARSTDATNIVAANGAGLGADLLMSPQQTPGVAPGSGVVSNMGTPTATAAATPAAGQSSVQPSPAAQNQIQGNIPAQTVQIAMAQLNAHLMNIAKQTGRPPMELPTYITKEYLQANPPYYAMLRQQMAHVVAQQKQKAQQQAQAQAQAQTSQQLQPTQQQQAQQGVANMAGSGPIGSPQMRPGLPPNMVAMSQMMQTMQNNAASMSTPGGAVGAAGANPAAGPPRPMMASPNMNPAAAAATSNQPTANANQLQPTKEDIILIREYCRMANIQLLGLQDPRFIILIAKAKSGELKNLLMTRYQAMNAQQQQQQLAAGTAPIRPNGVANPGAQAQQSQPQQQPQAQSQAQSLIQSPQDQQQQHANGLNAASQDSAAPTNQLPGASGAAAQTPSMASVNMPRDLSNLTPQDKQRFLEMMMQRKREAQQNAQPGQVLNQPAVSNQQAALASMAAMLQQQRQMNMTATNNMQSPMVRPAQLGGAANQAHQRPISAMMISPTPAPANLPGQVSAGQLLQHMASANMTPQQRQELLLRLQQMQSSQQQQQQQQQQQAAAPRPQINIAMIMQQITSGQLNPTMLPPQILSHLLQNSQIQLSAEHRQILQRALAHHFHMQQNNNATGTIQPGTTQ